MFGLLIKGFTALGTYAGVVAGVDVARKAVNRVAEGSEHEHAIAGFGDSIVSVLDPLDITGVRAGKERKREAELAKAKSEAEKQKIMRKHAEQDRKRAELAVKEAQKKAQEARNLAARAEKKAAQLDAQNRKTEAARLRENAQAQQRLAKLADRVASKAQATPDPAKAEGVAMSAIELAKQAMQPAANAVEAINKEFTAQGKSVAAALVDAIRRDDEPDYELLAAEIIGESADDSIEGPDTSVAGSDGSCCLACHLGGGSCGGASKAVPAPMVSGDFDTFDFNDDANPLNVNSEGDEEGFYDALMTAGADEWVDRALAAQHLEGLYGASNSQRPFENCVDGRCFVARK